MMYVVSKVGWKCMFSPLCIITYDNVFSFIYWVNFIISLVLIFEFLCYFFIKMSVKHFVTLWLKQCFINKGWLINWLTDWLILPAITMTAIQRIVQLNWGQHLRQCHPRSLKLLVYMLFCGWTWTSWTISVINK